MHGEEYRAMVQDQRTKGMLDTENGPLTKYQHVERLGHDEVEGLLDGDVVIVQDKIDGANLSVAWTEQHGLVIASRNRIVFGVGQPATGFNGAVQYVLERSEAFTDICSQGLILRGEWLVRHSISYPADKLFHFYVFDVQTWDGEYLPPSEYVNMLEEVDICYVPVKVFLHNPTVEQLTGMVDGPDFLGAEQKEGIVIKRYDFKNTWGHTKWGKLVSADFAEKNKISQGVTKRDPSSLRFAAEVIALEDVLKVIYKIKDEQGQISVRDMPRIIGMCWHDAFHERLWEFVKKRKIKEFNFADAKRLVGKSVREFALDYFNGVVMEAQEDAQ